MKIERIRLKNFRQFYGEHELELSTYSPKNVTLIHAENGFGKTTLLNSLLWAMYNETTKKFEKPDQIVSFESEKDGGHHAGVELLLSNEENEYRVSRGFDSCLTGNDKTELHAWTVEDGNNNGIINTPINFVNSIVPREMAKYFFFDGEAAEAYSSASNFKVIGSAIRNILGCSIAETAIEDIKELSRDIRKKIVALTSQTALEEAEKSIERIEARLVEIDAKLSSIEDDIITRDQQKGKIEEILRNAHATKQLQKHRDDLNANLIQTNARIKKAKADIVKWISSSAMAVVSKSLTDSTLDFIDEEELKGKIPSPYNEEFISQLLAAKECVCKRSLEPNTDAWNAVASLIHNASNAELLGRVTRAKARLEVLKEKQSEAPDMLDNIQADLAMLNQSRDNLESKLDEVSKQLAGSDISEIAQREQALRNIDHEIRALTNEQGSLRSEKNRVTKEKESLEKTLDKAAQENDKAYALSWRGDLLKQSIAELDSLLSKYEYEARTSIEARMNGILGEVAHKAYKCSFNEDFSLDLLFPDGRPTPKSGGENQLLSLMFIASLIEFSQSRIDNKNAILKPGTIAPLVLDAPFGQLDKQYQEDVARFLPTLAPQVVLLVSSSHASAEVMEALKPYVGAEYVLISESREPQGNKKDVVMNIHGKEYQCTLFDMPRNITRIEQVY